MLRTRLEARRREQASRNRPPLHQRSDEPHVQHSERLELTAWEMELLELLLHQPEVLPRLASSLPIAGIENEFCRRIYQQALDAMESGQAIGFEQLMLNTNDEAEKSLLVKCDELGHNKQESDTEQRVSDLLMHVTSQQEAARHQTQMAELKRNQLDPRTRARGTFRTV